MPAPAQTHVHAIRAGLIRLAPRLSARMPARTADRAPAPTRVHALATAGWEAHAAPVCETNLSSRITSACQMLRTLFIHDSCSRLFWICLV